MLTFATVVTGTDEFEAATSLGFDSATSVFVAESFSKRLDRYLRADGIFRSATEPGEPDVPHVQNVRARYRFRFNLDTDIHPLVSLHAQLTTGPINNPSTADQDFTATTARHPFFISEAWIDFHPTSHSSFKEDSKRAITLTPLCSMHNLLEMSRRVLTKGMQC